MLFAGPRVPHIWGMSLETEAPERPSLFNTTPPIVLGLIVVIVAVSVGQFLAPPELENFMVTTGALIDMGQFPDTPRALGAYGGYVLHVFLHGGVLHLGLNMFALLSFGSVTAAVMGRTQRGALAFLAFFFFCAIGGALAQVALFQVQPEGGYAIGASSAISGLLPALGWLQGGWKRAVQISVPWVLINLALAVFGGLSPIAIAWAAHLGGLVAGFSYPVFVRWART